MKLTDEQQALFEQFKAFMDDDTKAVFILKGYAGTGKTTMVKEMVNWLDAGHRSFQLMAPTGRAAKILKEKTGAEASTIHRGIYNMKDLATEEEMDGDSFKHVVFHYGIALGPDNTHHLCIVDEASMVSSKKSEGEIWKFGTSILLNDLITYSRIDRGGKLLFVGDPAQLPPVGDNDSLALKEETFADFGVVSAELTTVLRQDGGSLILKNANKIRALLKQEQKNELVFEHDDHEVIPIANEAIADQYTAINSTPDFDSSVVICYSNKEADNFNKEIRRRLFTDPTTIQKGDMLMVVSNNYDRNRHDLTEEEFMETTDIMNGEFVKVIDVSPSTEKLSAPVYLLKEGRRIKENVTLTYRNATIQLSDGKIVNRKLVDDLLNNDEPRLTYAQTISMFVNFKIRHPEVKPDSDLYADLIKQDPYLNALQAKYGYAITGHKSQGGEWDTTFVSFLGNDVSVNSLRWTYTATTRARRVLYGTNLPNLRPLDKLKLTGISPLKNKPCEFEPAQGEQKSCPTPYHGENTYEEVRAKYWEVTGKLVGSRFSISKVESKPYREIYFIECEGAPIRLDATYNGKQVFKDFTADTDSPVANDLLALVNGKGSQTAALDYNGSTPPLQQLYERMATACKACGIHITNVCEYLDNYRVLYCLKTDADFAILNFFTDKKGFITYGSPQSANGDKDEKLQQLVKELS